GLGSGVRALPLPHMQTIGLVQFFGGRDDRKMYADRGRMLLREGGLQRGEILLAPPRRGATAARGAPSSARPRNGTGRRRRPQPGLLGSPGKAGAVGRALGGAPCPRAQRGRDRPSRLPEPPSPWPRRPGP